MLESSGLVKLRRAVPRGVSIYQNACALPFGMLSVQNGPNCAVETNLQGWCCSAENNDVKMKNAIWSRIDLVIVSSGFGTGAPDGARLNLDFYDLAVEKQQAL